MRHNASLVIVALISRPEVRAAHLGVVEQHGGAFAGAPACTLLEQREIAVGARVRAL
jgi:hypothetical protein